MKVFFDNNVPAPLRSLLPGHEVTTARQKGWQELKNGDVLAAAETGGFDVFVTGDKNLAYQQNLKDRKIALVVLPTIHWKTLRQNAAPVLAAVDRATPGSFEALFAPVSVGRPPRQSGPQPTAPRSEADMLLDQLTGVAPPGPDVQPGQALRDDLAAGKGRTMRQRRSVTPNPADRD